MASLQSMKSLLFLAAIALLLFIAAFSVISRTENLGTFFTDRTITNSERRNCHLFRRVGDVTTYSQTM